MELRCVYCESKLKIMSKKNKNNVAFKCPKCKNTLLYKDSMIFAYDPLKKPGCRPFYYLLINGEAMVLNESYYGFKVLDGKLVQDNKDPEFVMQKTPQGYLFINEKKNVRVNSLAAGKKILSLGDSLDIDEINIIYFDGYFFESKKQKEKELTSGEQTLELNLGSDKDKWKSYLEKEKDQGIALNITKAELIMQSDDENITFEINKDEETSIGRGFTDISLMDPRMSKKHAVIRYSESRKGFVIEDLKSTNGTFLNGEKVEGSREIKDGDIIQIANTYFRFKTC